MRTNLPIITHSAMATGSIARNVACHPKFWIIAAPPTRPTTAPPGKGRAEYRLAYCHLFLGEDFPDDSKGDWEHGHPDALHGPCHYHELDVGGKAPGYDAYNVDAHHDEQYLFLAIDV
jgi:hypothetical protein